MDFNLQFKRECLKYKALKMTFGPLLLQKYEIFQKRRETLPKWLWKFIIWKEKDLICTDILFSMAQYTKTEGRNTCMFKVDYIIGLLPLLGRRPPTSCLHTTRSCAVFSPVLSRTFNICLQIPSPAITWFTSFPFYLGVPCNSKVSLNSKSLQLNNMNCPSFNSFIMPIVI